MPRSVRAFLLACILLPACGRHRPRVMSETEKSRALDAMKHLQAEINTGNCDLIFEEASRNFRQQDRRDWRRECRLIKYDLGSWKSFQVTGTENWTAEGPAFGLFASAEFQNKDTNICAVWMFDGEKVKLFMLALQQDEYHWKNIPAPTLNRGPWVDPPPAKSPHNGVIL